MMVKNRHNVLLRSSRLDAGLYDSAAATDDCLTTADAGAAEAATSASPGATEYSDTNKRGGSGLITIYTPLNKEHIKESINIYISVKKHEYKNIAHEIYSFKSA